MAAKNKVDKKKKVEIRPEDFADYGDFMKAKKEAEVKKENK